MKRAVSYSFFRSRTSVYEQTKGNAALQFQQFLPVLLRAHLLVWKDWDLVIHHDEQVESLPYFKVLRKLQESGSLQLVFMGRADDVGLCRAMLWRMRPVFTGEYEAVICRDIDAPHSRRDRAAVMDWLENSNKAVHVIHDNPAHGGVMGGTLGIRCAPFRAEFIKDGQTWETFVARMCRRLATWEWRKHGTDQNFLNESILPFVRNQILLHTSNTDGAKRLPEETEVRKLPTLKAGEVGVGVCDWPGRLTQDLVGTPGWVAADTFLQTVETACGLKIVWGDDRDTVFEERA